VKRLVAVGTAAALTVLVAIPTVAAAGPAARKGGWIVCREHPILHISPPLTLDASHPATFRVSDVLESCSSSDRTIDRGIASITGESPNASCQSGDVNNGVARIRWDNGRTSRVRFTASYAGGFARASGRVVGGSAFVGRRFRALDHLNVDAVALQLCSTPSIGLSTLASDGVIAIGAPPSDGVVWTP
jgi:hypothetical protein